MYRVSEKVLAKVSFIIGSNSGHSTRIGIAFVAIYVASLLLAVFLILIFIIFVNSLPHVH